MTSPGSSSIDPHLPTPAELRSLDLRTNALAWQAAFPPLWSSALQLLSILLPGAEHAHDREDIAARALAELTRSLIEKNLPSFHQIQTFDDVLDMNRQIVRARTKDYFRQRGRPLEDLAAEPPGSAADGLATDSSAGGETALARDPALADEFTAQAKTSAASVPGHVLNVLDEARRGALSTRHAAEVTQSGARNVAAFQPAKEPSRDYSVWLVLAACLLAFAGVAVIFLPAKNPSKDIAVFAPRGATGFTRPRLVWDARPGQKYDVWILPAEGSHADAPALFIAKGVLPPVAFADLKPGPAWKGKPVPQGLTPGQEYRLLICLSGAGRLAGTAYSFQTAPNAAATAPPTGLEAAQKLAAGGRPADALAALAELPAEQRERPEARDLEDQLRAQILSSPPR